jgi:hypothetical protein
VSSWYDGFFARAIMSSTCLSFGFNGIVRQAARARHGWRKRRMMP